MSDQDQNRKENVEGVVNKGFEEKKEEGARPDDFINEEKSELAEEVREMKEKENALEKEKPYLEKIKEKISQGSASDDKDDKADGKDDVKKQAQEIYALQDADQQVEKLLQLAMQEDPFQAIKVAEHLDENYVLDKLHDGLLKEKIQKILKEKGILK